MFKTTVRYLFLLALFSVFAATRVFAQATITIGTVDVGPYSPGSTIAIPFHVNDATGCISQNNVFTVEMSDASGSFASPTVVATSAANTFYANFLNATVPNGTPAGIGYKFRVKASSAGVSTSSASNVVTINNAAGATAVAAAASQPTITSEVFGQCNGPSSAYDIFDNSSGATSLTASFYNETTQTLEASNQNILGAGYHFTANAATYTVFVKAINAAGKISTKAYLLINNQVNSSIGIQGNGTVCISSGPGGNAPLTYNIDVTGTNGIQKNYPGNLYTFSWGDGTPNTVLTLCEIIALNGQVTHPYTRPSCGNASGQNNRFQVDISISNTYCNNIGSRVTSYALILTTPTNSIQGLASPNICTGTTVTFTNASDPGVDPNSSTLTCTPNTNARYTWYVDGVLQTSPAGVPIGTGLTYTFSTHGTHTVTLRALNSNGGACTAADATFTVCVQDPSVADFTIPAGPICKTTPVTPVNTTVIDLVSTCAPTTYAWSVSPATYTIVGSLTDAAPQFTFTAPGIYTIQLQATSVCGTTTQTKTITVEDTPTAQLKQDLVLCGAPQTIDFNATSTTTGVAFTGTPTAGATTYTWSVTGGSFSFASGYNSHSQYPQIIFNDIATYTVTVTHTNSCGTATDSQNITFQQAPVPNAGSTQIVCQSAGVVHLSGTVGGGAYDSSQWSVIPPGNGTFTNGTSLNADYTPSAADWTRGSVTLRLTTFTSGLPAPCNQVTSDVVITLVRTTTINSASSKTICSGDNINYIITSNNDALTPAPTFAWTASVTSGTATGFTASGTTKTITDVLVNSNPTVTATITYHIIPTTNGCAGTPFDYIVTIPAVPVVTPAAANPTICSNSPAGITMTSSLANTKYTWTVSAPAGINGATAQSTLTSTAAITNTLVNTTSGTLTVTYTITPYNTNNCPGTPVPISVDVYPAPTQSVAGTTQNLCGATSTVLAANSPGVGETGKWTVVTGTGLTFANDTDPLTTVSGLVDGGNYTLRWTITNGSNCSTSSTVNISVTAATVGGTTAGATTICSGSGGNITLSGKVGNVLKWQRSIDAGANWIDVANTTTTLTYANLTQTTQYRAVVQNGTCNIEFSTVSIVNVNPPTPQAVAGSAQQLCNATIVTLNATAPGGSFTGQWTQTAGPTAGVTITDPTNPATTVTGITGGTSSNTYTFTWTVFGLPPCGNTTASVNITDFAASIGGTTATVNPTTVCSGGNTGTITLSGQLGSVLRWERSTDGGTTWTNIINTTTSLSYTNLTQTTQFRAAVQNTGACNIDYSTPTTINVNPPTPQAVAGNAQQLCNATVVTLNATAPGGSFTGQWTQTAGPTAGVTITDPTNPATTVTGITGSTSSNTYTFTWTVNGFAPCGPTSASVNIVDYAASVGGTTATVNPTTVCSGSNAGTITLSGQLGSILRWERSTDGGSTWTSIANTATSLSYTNLTQTTQFRAAVQNSGACNIEFSTATTITVNPPSPIATIVGGNQRFCNASVITLTGNDPGAPFNARWTQTSGPAVIITNPNSYQTTVTGLIGGNTYAFTWTIDGLAPCGPSSASTTIINDAATVPGVTSTVNPTTVCSGSNGGTITLTGQVGTILRWEKSTDDGNTWATVTPLNTSTSLSFLNLTQTTLYRVVVQSGVCSPPQNSSVTKITVNPPAPIANAGINQIQCNVSTITLTGNNPGTFAGVWTQTSGPLVTITNPANYQTTVTGLSGGNNYTFTWTITPLLPCTPTSSQVTITNNADVVASFTTSPKTGCGNLTVRFTNTSNNQVGANFQWNFGDGSTSTTASPQHTFAQRTDGRDTTYYISLKVVGNCIDRPAIIDSVLVRPATPIARILPESTNGCGNFAINVRNTSPGNNVSYDYYLYDGATLVQKITSTDKNNVIFNPITTITRKVFTLYMIATGYCGTTNETTHIPIAISPANVVGQMFLQNDLHASCAPLNTTFVNNSFGGNNFYYTIYDANNNIVDKPTASTTTLPYTFTKAGTYYVTITAVNNCGSNESPRTRIDVYPTPKPSFVADVTTACKNLRVTFTNNTNTDDPVTPATSLVYDWDFGDGSTHSALFAPVHSYKTSGSYTVTLTATNTTSGCSNVFTRQSYIIINAPPSPAFSAQPDSLIHIPNYTFAFVDKSKGNPTAWKWQFSDGQVSNKQNPIITFADTGTYKVTFTTYSAAGCDSTITGKVRIDGVPGQLFLPNAFMPTSATNDLREFRAKGSGIKQWHLQVYDIYGQLLWETTKLTAKGEPAEGWDGTFKGVPMPQGVYQWQASALFINGNEWKGNAYGSELPKRVGSIHLLK